MKNILFSMKTKIIYIIFIVFISLPSICLADGIGYVCGGGKIDSEVMKYIDVTGDGYVDEIALHIESDDMCSPFRWSIKVFVFGDIAYEVSRDDTPYDSFFGENFFVDGCNDYFSCKNKWYFSDIVKCVVVGRGDYDLDGIIKSKYGLHGVGYVFLTNNLLFEKSKAEDILKLVEKRLRSGESIVVSFPITPVKMDFLVVFVPELGKFIPIYED